MRPPARPKSRPQPARARAAPATSAGGAAAGPGGAPAASGGQPLHGKAEDARLDDQRAVGRHEGQIDSDAAAQQLAQRLRAIGRAQRVRPRAA